MNLSELQTRKARIQVKGHGHTWTGQLIGLYREPVLLLIEEDGRLVVLPQSHRVTELPVTPADLDRIRAAAVRSGFSPAEVRELTAALDASC